jgi:hypothetical protein
MSTMQKSLSVVLLVSVLAGGSVCLAEDAHNNGLNPSEVRDLSAASGVPRRPNQQDRLRQDGLQQNGLQDAYRIHTETEQATGLDLKGPPAKAAPDALGGTCPLTVPCTSLVDF